MKEYWSKTLQDESLKDNPVVPPTPINVSFSFRLLFFRIKAVREHFQIQVPLQGLSQACEDDGKDIAEGTVLESNTDLPGNFAV